MLLKRSQTHTWKEVRSFVYTCMKVLNPYSPGAQCSVLGHFLIWDLHTIFCMQWLYCKSCQAVIWLDAVLLIEEEWNWCWHSLGCLLCGILALTRIGLVWTGSRMSVTVLMYKIVPWQYYNKREPALRCIHVHVLMACLWAAMHRKDGLELMVIMLIWIALQNAWRKYDPSLASLVYLCQVATMP